MATLAISPARPSSDSDLPDGYYDVNEAAAKLRVGVRFLRDGVNHSGFPHARMNRRLVFSETDLALIYAMFRVPVQIKRGRRAAA